MAIDIDAVREIARLAYLEKPRVEHADGTWTEPDDPLLAKAELERLAHELGAILDYVAQLDELELDDVESTSHGVPLPPLFRADEAGGELDTDEALERAPKSAGRSYSVPKIID